MGGCVLGFVGQLVNCGVECVVCLTVKLGSQVRLPRNLINAKREGRATQLYLSIWGFGI